MTDSSCFYNAQGEYDCDKNSTGLRKPVPQMFDQDAKPINRQSNQTFRQSTEVELREFFTNPMQTKAHSIIPVAANNYREDTAQNINFLFQH